MPLDRLIAALTACEVKAFVIPTPLNLWRKQPITDADYRKRIVDAVLEFWARQTPATTKEEI